MVSEEHRQLKIWVSGNFPEKVWARLATAISLAGGVITSEERDLEVATIAFGQPNVTALMSSESLRWIQLDSAGYERYDRDDLRGHLNSRDLVITNSSSVYAQPCAEHLLAMMFAIARRLPGAMIAQATNQGWPMSTLRAESRLLSGSQALLLGYGAIGRTVASLLRPLQMELIGYRRTPNGREEIPVIGYSELSIALSQADHVINILPASSATLRFCDSEFFRQLKPGAVFYNIGRGVTVDQEALQEVLISGHLAAAGLDVTDPEPLPPHHPLWTTPNCLITPHTAGGHDQEKEVLADHFLRNFERYLKRQPLENQILG